MASLPFRHSGWNNLPLVVMGIAIGLVALKQSACSYNLTWDTVDGYTSREGNGYILGDTIGEPGAKW